MATDVTIIASKELPRSGSPLTLKPIKGRFDQIETERVYRVIENGMRKYKEQKTLLSMISDDKKLFCITDVDLRMLVLKHQYLVNKFEANQTTYHDVQDSLKNILRYTEVNGIPLYSYAKIEVPIFSTDLQHYLYELSLLTQNKLATKKKDADKLNKLQVETMYKNRGHQMVINSLSKILEKKSKEKVLELTEKDKRVKELTQDLNFINLSVTDRNNKTLNEATKQILSDVKSSEAQRSRLLQNIIEKQKEMMTTMNPNQSEESKMRKRKMKMHVELQNWFNKYDDNMCRMQDELEELQEEHRIEIKNLQEAEEHHDEVKIEYDVIVATKQRMREEEERKREEFEHEMKSAAMIQALWRGYAQRHNIAAKSKGKKDKGKGKKGGKKKKK